MVAIPPETLDRPPEEGARVVALRPLEQARAALKRMDDPEDAEALHDFRVSLRRLRSNLRAYASYLEPRGMRRGIRRARELGSRTNLSRDLEVQVGWLRDHRPDLGPAARRAADELVGELERQRAEPSAPLDVAKGFAKLYRALRGSLDEYSTVIRLGTGPARPSFANAGAHLLREHSAELAERLALVRSPLDQDEAHSARIQVKRTRYVLEPFVAHVHRGKPALRRLKDLQELLGELNDLRLLIRTLAGSLERAALRQAQAQLEAELWEDAEAARLLRRRTHENGLIALARCISARRRELFEKLEKRWLGEEPASFFDEIDGICLELERHGSPPLEIERKFLLKTLPEIVGDAASVKIDQGWLSGQKIRERLRRTRGPNGERFFRTIKLGTGLTRTEFEEEIAPDVFERLWPLTEGTRVAKRRYLVEAGDLVWEIDEFLDQELVLAEVELPTEDTPVEIPEWLAPCLDREVTEEPAYTNLSLAR